MKRLFILFIIFVIPVSFLFSFDYGFLLDQKTDINKDLITFNPGISPWYSWNGGRNLTVDISGTITFSYNYFTDNTIPNAWADPSVIFELTRLSFRYTEGRSFFIDTGRIRYSDILGINVNGIFDGVFIQKEFSKGDFNAALLYTGLQYKNTAKIVMNIGDEIRYAMPFVTRQDYFASERFLAAGRVIMPAAENNKLSLEAILQFDLNGGNDRLYSQYAQIQYDIFGDSSIVSLGVIAELMETSGGDFSTAAAAQFVWRTGSKSGNQGFRFTSRLGSGPHSDIFTSFVPVNSPALGEIFPFTISGNWLNRLNYEIRLSKTIFTDLSASYFIRTWSDDKEPGNLYGAEARAAFIWQPLDDLRFYFGGAMYMPSLGNIYPSNSDMQWIANAGFSLSM